MENFIEVDGVSWFTWDNESKSIAILGELLYLFRIDDVRPAIEQIYERYEGGWDSWCKPDEPDKFTLNTDTWMLSYPNARDMAPLWFAHLPSNDESVYVYENKWVCIFNRATENFDVAKLD
jgi:hypothetical protein